MSCTKAKNTKNKQMRMPKNVTEHYTSLAELSSRSMRTKNLEKLEKQRENFMQTYGKCKICGSNYKYIKGTNLLVCSRDSEKECSAEPNVIYMRKKSAEIADTLFD